VDYIILFLLGKALLGGYYWLLVLVYNFMQTPLNPVLLGLSES